jgi:hypothetical protein
MYRYAHRHGPPTPGALQGQENMLGPGARWSFVVQVRTQGSEEPVREQLAAFAIPRSNGTCHWLPLTSPTHARRDAMTEPDDTMTRTGKGIELSQHGEREARTSHVCPGLERHGRGERRPLPPLRAGPLDGRRSREDLHVELVWDLRALEAADPITDERAAQAGVTSPVAGFYPSLHLNMGECYRKLGDRDESPRAPQGRSSCCRHARRRRLRQRDSGADSTGWVNSWRPPES